MDFLPSLLGNRALRRDAERSHGQMVKTVDGVAGHLGTEQKAIFADYASRFYSNGRIMGEPEWSIERAVTQAYGRVVWVMKAVDTISGDSSSLLMRFGDRESRKWEPSKSADLLNDGKANPLEFGHQMRKRLSGQILLSPYGALVERTRNNGGTPMRYDLLPPSRTRIIPVEQGADLVSHVEVTRPNGGYYRIEWDDVLWFRNPHLYDPFRAATPLEAAGMSVELDYFARLYNVSFMRNDGRPGGVLAVRGTGERAADVSTTTLDRLERSFGKGPAEAGKITAITGDLTYQDFGNNPRDMQYAETAQNAKHEILSAFGTPESVLGYAADRKYDNASQEEKVYWTITMRAHNKIVETGFVDERDSDGQDVWLDTSEIDVLQQVEQQRLAVAREEFKDGLRSAYSYAVMAGIDDIEDTPFTRALYIPAGKTPLPARADDAEALGMGAAPADTPAGDTGAVDDQQPPAIASPAAAVAAISASPASPAEAVAAIEAKSIQPTSPQPARRTPRAARSLRIIREGETAESARTAVSTHPREDTDALTVALSDALTEVMTDTLNRAMARLDAPKTRKGTRHWQPEFAVDTRLGVKAVDAAKAVDDEATEDATRDVVEAVVVAAAVAAAAKVTADLIGASPSIRVTQAARGAAAVSVDWIATVMGDFARGLIEAINRGDQQGATIAQIREEVQRSSSALGARVRRFAGDAAHSVVVSARDAAALVLAGQDPAGDEPASPSQTPPAPQRPLDIRRTWRSKRDDAVRPSHKVADGQEVGPTVPFIVGGSLLRYPRDPFAPVRETAGCRCEVDYAVTDGVGLFPVTTLEYAT